MQQKAKEEKMAIEPQVEFTVGNHGKKDFYRLSVSQGTEVRFVSKHPRDLKILGNDGSERDLRRNGPPVNIGAFDTKFWIEDGNQQSEEVIVEVGGSEGDLCFVVREGDQGPKLSVAKILPEGTTEACVTVSNASDRYDLSIDIATTKAAGATGIALMLSRGSSATFKARIGRDPDEWITLSSTIEQEYPVRTQGQPGGTEQAEIVIIEP